MFFQAPSSERNPQNPGQKKFFFVAFLFFFFVFCALPHPAHAIAISPPVVEINDLLRGSTQAHSILLLRADNEEGRDLTIKVEKDGEAAAAIHGADSILFPADQKTISYPFEVESSNFGNDQYSALIIFTPAVEETGTKQSSGNGITIIDRIAANIKIKVTGQENVGYNFDGFRILDTESEQPITAKFTITNTGNVNWRPDEMVLRLQDTRVASNILQATLNGNTLPMVRPGNTTRFAISVPIFAMTGSYIGTITFKDKGATVGSLVSSAFTVYPPNTLAQKGELESVKTNKTTYTPGENVKLTALFHNIGGIGVQSVLVTEIYGQENGQLIDLKRTTPMTVDAGEIASLTDFFTLATQGNYTLTSYVEYGSRKTPSLTTYISVAAPVISTESRSSLMTYLLIGIPLILLLLLLLRLLRQKDKRK